MRHASLFSGIGGPEVAAAMLGWENVFHCEINPFGRAVLDYWFPDSRSYDDITKTDFKQYRGQIDVLTGGFPCQPFSYAGKRGGQTDDRYLWPEMLRVIDEIRPTWVVGENVAGITTMVESCEITDLGGETSLFEEDNGVHRFRAEHTFTIERICRDLESKGYSVQPVLIPACGVGAPHRRDRVFFIAHNDNASDSIHKRSLRKSSTNATKEGKERISERNEVQWSNESTDVRSQMQSAFDTIGQRWNEECDDNKITCQSSKEECREKQPSGTIGTFGEGLHDTKRWQCFPTQSAFCRGNDGIPFDVDSLSIPYSKWRSETIKAYGNAIVPQVMYRIFQCIDKTQRL